MVLKQKIIVLILHTLGLFFAYGSFGVLVHLVLKIDTPVSSLMNNNIYSAGVLITLPVISIILLFINRKYTVHKALAYLYLLLWLSTIIKIIFFTW